LLRQDNADERLTPHGRRVGLISDGRWERFCAKRAEITAEKARLEATLVDAATLRAFFDSHGLPAVTGLHLADLLRRPEFDYEDIAELDRERPTLSARVRLSAQCDVKYAGYVKRQLSEVNRQKRLEELRLPENIDYAEVRGLRIEARQKLSAIRPVTLGQASRISGVSPADISVLLIWLGLKK
jgi:tRNA uridine 5-carboxymethylaminomethyl modification enzyme